MNIHATQRTADGILDTISGIERYTPRDANYSQHALNLIMSNAQAAYEAALKLRDMQTAGLPWADRSRSYEEQRLADAVRLMADVQGERVEKGYAKS